MLFSVGAAATVIGWLERKPVPAIVGLIMVGLVLVTRVNAGGALL